MSQISYSRELDQGSEAEIEAWMESVRVNRRNRFESRGLSVAEQLAQINNTSARFDPSVTYYNGRRFAGKWILGNGVVCVPVVDGSVYCNGAKGLPPDKGRRKPSEN